MMNRVPLGFVCGYPVGIGGEMYGGSMFIKSAASDGPQSKSIQAVNEKWGEGKWNGTETIGIQVCKKKYSPFSFRVVEEGPDGRKIVRVQRMFGCHCHSEIRRQVIETHGLRTGWEPFGQWSMRKAQELARRETDRINGGTKAAADASSSSSSEDSSLSDSEDSDEEELTTSDEELKTICHNGKCTWKMREKYDNIYREVTGNDDSDSE